MFSFICMLSYSLKLSWMVKAGYFLLFPPPKKEPNTHHMDTEIALPLGFVPHILLNCFPARRVPGMKTAPWSHGLSWAVMCGQMLLPWPWWSLLFALLLKLSSALSPVCHHPFFFFFLLECQQIQQDFVFDSPTCPYCLLYICLVAVQFPSFPCPNVVIGYCCLLRNERCYLKGCYH